MSYEQFPYALSTQVREGRVLTRRTFCQAIGASTAFAGLSGLAPTVLANSQALRSKRKAVIVLWMQGGPSQFETFDPKIGSTSGGTKAIDTAVPGTRIAEFLPNVAKQMNDISIIRSMTNREGNHQRATYQLHTGYIPSGGIRHPAFGSWVARDLAPADYDLPSFVAINGNSSDSGFLSNKFSPLIIRRVGQRPENTQLMVSENRFDRRMDLLKKLEKPYADAGAADAVEAHQQVYQQAAKMALSPRLQAFDLANEPQKVRDRYGKSSFGQGCLLARRLVQEGVSYVEVSLGNWDHHQDIKDRIKPLVNQTDVGFAALVEDLKQKGMLDNTLVVWMGEFGRTPRVNGRSGRDHYPRAFSVALAGGGVKGGQVIGRTNGTGSAVTDRPVKVPDLFQTICHSLDIKAHQEEMTPVGRPIKMVDGGKPVKELFS